MALTRLRRWFDSNRDYQSTPVSVPGSSKLGAVEEALKKSRLVECTALDSLILV